MVALEVVDALGPVPTVTVKLSVCDPAASPSVASGPACTVMSSASGRLICAAGTSVPSNRTPVLSAGSSTGWWVVMVVESTGTESSMS